MGEPLTWDSSRKIFKNVSQDVTIISHRYKDGASSWGPTTWGFASETNYLMKAGATEQMGKDFDYPWFDEQALYRSKMDVLVDGTVMESWTRVVRRKDGWRSVGDDFVLTFKLKPVKAIFRLQPVLMCHPGTDAKYTKETTIEHGITSTSYSSTATHTFVANTSAVVNKLKPSASVRAEMRSVFSSAASSGYKKEVKKDTVHIDTSKKGFYMYQAQMVVVMSNGGTVETASSCTITSPDPLGDLQHEYALA